MRTEHNMCDAESFYPAMVFPAIENRHNHANNQIYEKRLEVTVVSRT